MKGLFITGDIFSENLEDGLVETRGDWYVISVAMFLHLFDWTDRVRAYRAI
jgi:hypothetical protein